MAGLFRLRGLVGRGLVTIAVVAGALPSSVAAQSAPPADPPVPAAPAPMPPRISQDVFVTASIAPVSTADVSRDVAIISRTDLDLFGLKSIIEALRLVPGVDVRARGPLDVQTDFSIRGATFGQNLILSDGVRLNNSQSGHHNGEIPLPAIAVDRVEVVEGAGSAVHGADALGGTINVISRRGPYAAGSVTYGQHAYIDTQAAVGGGALPAGWMLTGWGSHSDGFMVDRNFTSGGAAVRGTLAHGLIVDVRHQRRAFGANGFYGPSPSQEWTDQTLAAAQYTHVGLAWTTVVETSFLNHGDRFIYDPTQPALESRHRTNALDVQVQGERRIGTSTLTIGAAGGGDRVRSNNLGNHEYQRGSAFGEWQAPLGDRTTLMAGVRFDDYTTFGHSASPSLSIARHATRNLRLRMSGGHAFRIPTFTERFYTNAANQGTPDLRAERGWSVDGGADLTRGAWTSSLSVFTRWDQDVIDWLRPTDNDIWRSANVRDVATHGVEAGIRGHKGPAHVRAYYTGIDVNAPSVAQKSKYVLEYARHQAGGSISALIGGGVRIALNADFRNRLVAQAWQSYTLVSARVGRTFGRTGRTEIYLDGSNLLDTTYQEIAGVAMPGRWVSMGVTVR